MEANATKLDPTPAWNQAMEKVKTHVEQRVRKHLMTRHKVKDRGIGEGRFPSVQLYERHGLYKVQQKRAGDRRMPRCEKYRKAVCEKIACTV